MATRWLSLVAERRVACRATVLMIASGAHRMGRPTWRLWRLHSKSCGGRAKRRPCAQQCLGERFFKSWRPIGQESTCALGDAEMLRTAPSGAMRPPLRPPPCCAQSAMLAPVPSGAGHFSRSLLGALVGQLPTDGHHPSVFVMLHVDMGSAECSGVRSPMPWRPAGRESSCALSDAEMLRTAPAGAMRPNIEPTAILRATCHVGAAAIWGGPLLAASPGASGRPAAYGLAPRKRPCDGACRHGSGLNAGRMPALHGSGLNAGRARMRDGAVRVSSLVRTLLDPLAARPSQVLGTAWRW